MQRLPKAANTNSRRYCSVPQCSSYKTTDNTLHYFPHDPSLALKWKNILKIGKPLQRFMCVCSLHFTEDDHRPGKLNHYIIKRLKVRLEFENNVTFF